MCINGNILSLVNTCRDLGILISSDLSPSTHIDSIVAKAHQCANAILRCFVSRDPALLTRAYTVYIRPVIEHNCVTWLPHLKQEIEKNSYVDFKGFHMVKDCISCNCALWKCDGCVTILHLGV